MDPAAWELFRRRALGELPSAAAAARAVGAGLPRSDLGRLDEPGLRRAHAAGLEAWRAAAPRPAGEGEATLLDVSRALARGLLGPCRLCWLRCPVDRRTGPAGRCGLGPELRVYRDYVHLGEEPELIPTHAVFLAGCSLRCAYCSDWAHVDRPLDDPATAAGRLAASIDARRAEGARSLTFVGGDPGMSLPGLLDALALVRASTPVVWNSNLTGTPEAHDLLEVVVDAHVADLKYGAEACSRAGSAAPFALAAVHANLRRVAGERALLIVRHLVLPGHVDCCARPALDWLAANAPRARVNLLGQFEPVPEVRGTAWDRRVAPDELEAARAHGRALGLDLDGPGPLPPPAPGAPTGVASAAPPLETTIRVDDRGRIVLEDLPPELADLAALLAGDDPDLDARRAAAAPWLPPP